jgi:hypothetical protein
MRAETKVIDLAVSTTEVRSIADIAGLIVDEIQVFATKYGVADQFDRDKIEEDLAIFLVQRRKVRLEELRVSIVDGGVEFGNTIQGNRIADLLFRIHYKDSSRSGRL